MCDYDAGTLTLVYKVVGGGTEQMSRMRPGQRLDLLTGLGNGFMLRDEVRRPLLVGGVVVCVAAALLIRRKGDSAGK